MLILNEESAISFAQKIEQTLYQEEIEFFNTSFDLDYIKTEISKNSILLSSLDTDFGKELFRQSIELGKYIVEALKDGGNYQFVRYYCQDSIHHLIFRLYANEGVTIDDYELTMVDNQIKIKNGFNYNLGVTLIEKIKYSILFNLMRKTDPDGNTSIIAHAAQLMQEDKNREAVNFLQKNHLLIEEYPHYLQLLLQSNFLSNPNKFISFLNSLNLDKRTELIHQFLYYTNRGEVNSLQNTINQLIDYTGDDPIYLFFYAKANYIAKKYDDAFICYQQIGNSLPLFWDFWYTQLETYAQLNKKDEFIETLLLGEKYYQLEEEDLMLITEEEFPKMFSFVQEYFSK